jgi:predicted TIM-barrel fold metal-dependent hydrolase
MGMSIEELQRRTDFRADAPATVTLLPDPEPRPRWATIFSADDHVVEPPDIFVGRFAARFADAAPRVVDTQGGGQAWRWLDQELPNIGFNAVAGRPPEELSFEPVRFEHMRSGAWDVHARLHDMDLNGVWASVCFPSFLPGFVGQRLTLWPKDDALALAAMRAYNDWHLEAWCGADPTRFVPQQIAYLRDPEVAAAEIRRNADRGFKAVTFSEAPYKLGLPTIHSGHWDPFLAACAETQTVVSLHVGSAGETPTTSADAPPLVIGHLFAASAFTSTVDWLYSGIPVRFPDIRICMSEGGIGWVPGVIDRVEHVNARNVLDADSPDADLLRRNFWFCALDEPSGFRAADVIGYENIVVESDYPHSDSTWPDTQPLLAAHLADLPVDAQLRICWQNGVELFRHPAPSDPRP